MRNEYVIKHKARHPREKNNYHFDPKCNVQNRPICKKCKYRKMIDSHIYICDCLNMTGQRRDKNGTLSTCATFKEKRQSK